MTRALHYRNTIDYELFLFLLTVSRCNLLSSFTCSVSVCLSLVKSNKLNYAYSPVNIINKFCKHSKSENEIILFWQNKSTATNLRVIINALQEKCNVISQDVINNLIRSMAKIGCNNQFEELEKAEEYWL